MPVERREQGQSSLGLREWQWAPQAATGPFGKEWHGLRCICKGSFQTWGRGRPRGEEGMVGGLRHSWTGEPENGGWCGILVQGMISRTPAGVGQEAKGRIQNVLSLGFAMNP